MFHSLINTNVSVARNFEDMLLITQNINILVVIVIFGQNV